MARFPLISQRYSIAQPVGEAPNLLSTLLISAPAKDFVKADYGSVRLVKFGQTKVQARTRSAAARLGEIEITHPRRTNSAATRTAATAFHLREMLPDKNRTGSRTTSSIRV